MDRQANGINEVERRPSKMLRETHRFGTNLGSSCQVQKMSCEAFWKARASAVLRSLHEQAERGESLMMAATLDIFPHVFPKRILVIRNLSMPTANHCLLSSQQVTHF